MKKRPLVFVLCLALGLAVGAATGDAPTPGSAVLVTMDGVINPITEEYFRRVLTGAEAAGAELVLVEMDTPGGLMESMREIVKMIQNARVPVAVYVAPQGARAASAGTFITMAAHVAVMAPNTNMGAAHPVSVGGGSKDDDKTMMEKITNDTVVWIREIARTHGRNADWAEKAVRESVSIGAKDALKERVVDLIAESRHELFKLADGRTVEVTSSSGERRKVTLKTRDCRVVAMPMTLQEEVLHTAGSPNIAYMLLMVGGLAIVFEVTHPGAILPGVVGVIALSLAFMGLKILPISYVGLLLIIFSLIFFVLDLKLATGGALTVGGVVALVMGSYMLIEIPELKVSKASIGAVAATITSIFVFVLGKAVQDLRRPASTGAEAMVGRGAVAREDFDREGLVTYEGELWKAIHDAPGMIKAGDRVKITGLDELKLRVIRVPPGE